MKINLMTTEQVTRRLGVKAQTVYAYVSRGLLTRTFDARGRRSLFRAAEVEALARRGRPRAGAPTAGGVALAITSAITELSADALRFRGYDARELAQACSFEAVCELLWTGALQPNVRWARDERLPTARLPAGTAPLERFCAVLAQQAARDPLRIDLGTARVVAVGRRVLWGFVESLPVLSAAPVKPLASARLAAVLWPRVSPLRAEPQRVALLEMALVLLADHELATSTLAARIAASTRAHPFAVVAAGLAALSGPLHGKAAERVQRVLRAAQHSTPPELALAHTLGQTRLVAGFGHPVYERGDVRARVLLPRVLSLASAQERRVIEATRLHGEQSTGLLPNIDFALAALAFVCGMPLGITEAIFAIARSAGLLAHGLEEYAEPPLRFRARALYTGPVERRVVRANS